MRSVVRFDLEQASPQREDILVAQGMPRNATLPARVRAALESAFALFAELAQPVGVIEEIEAGEFAFVYAGEGCNPPESPLPGVVPKARGLALYAATLGEAASARIAELFHEHELALAYLLDAVASASADRLSALLSERFASALRERGLPEDATRVLPYSPGYCGWHVSGQRRLFARLKPQEIGIHLNQSFLMTPLKSVSGVLVAGPAEAHRFRPDFPFCDACATHDCRHRLASLARPRTSHGPVEEHRC
jgi:hypothetical protein